MFMLNKLFESESESKGTDESSPYFFLITIPVL